MKKILFILAALSLAATACQKTETSEGPYYSNVKVNLSVTMPGTLTKTNFSLTDPSNPVSGMNVTWKKGDRLTLIVFQGDNANWKDNYVSADIILSDAAEGSSSADISSLGTSLDLSGFDSSQNLKYVVVLGPAGRAMSDYWKEFSIWNGFSSLYTTYTASEQIHNSGMIAETDVQEVPFPSGTLSLSGSLHWITSVLAVQFDIDPAADITYDANSYLVIMLSGSQYVNNYTPITKVSSDGGSHTDISFVKFESDLKLSDALDANNCRYVTIPADDMTVKSSQKLGGSSISFYKYLSSNTHYSSTGTIPAETVIEAGKVYGIKIKVTDADSDGVPEFTKM